MGNKGPFYNLLYLKFGNTEIHYAELFRIDREKGDYLVDTCEN